MNHDIAEPLEMAVGNDGGDMPPGDMEHDEGVPVFSFGDFRDDDILTKTGMSQVFKCTFRTVQRMVERYEIPPATQFAGRNVWIVGRLKAWIANMAENREMEALKQAKRFNVFKK